MLSSVNTVNTPVEVDRPPRRRERVRAATEAEILATARGLLVEGGLQALTLREVGRRMGMTASALYRYVDGHDALLDALVESLLAELTDGIEARVAAQPPQQDLTQALMAASHEFRDWSLAHPAEFGLVFGPRPLGYTLPPDSGEERQFSRFGDVFGRLLFPGAPSLHAPGDKAGMPDELADLFVRAWVRLLGTVSVEVFGHARWSPMSPLAIFEAELSDVCRLLRRPPDDDKGPHPA